MSIQAHPKYTCIDLDALLDARFGAVAASLPELAMRHFERCVRCRELYHWALSAVPPAEISAELQARITSNLTASIEPVKPLPPDRVFITRFLGTFLLLVVLVSAMMGWSGIHKMAPWQSLIAVALFGAVAVLLAFSAIAQMIPGCRMRFAPSLLVPTFVTGFVAGVGLMFPWTSTGNFVQQGIRCSKAGLMLAIPAGLLFWWLIRKGAPLSFKALGATLGATAGLLAVAVLQFTCTVQEAPHLAVWHGGALVASCLLGMLVGMLFDRIALWRRASSR